MLALHTHTWAKTKCSGVYTLQKWLAFDSERNIKVQENFEILQETAKLKNKNKSEVLNSQSHRMIQPISQLSSTGDLLCQR